VSPYQFSPEKEGRGSALGKPPPCATNTTTMYYRRYTEQKKGKRRRRRNEGKGAAPPTAAVFDRRKGRGWSEWVEEDEGEPFPGLVSSESRRKGRDLSFWVRVFRTFERIFGPLIVRLNLRR
jgi:hypothetical protein